MALGLKTIREALETRLAAGVTGRQTNVYAYPPDQPQFPAIGVIAGDGDFITYWESMSESGIASVRLTLRLYLSARYVDAQIAIDDYLSAGSGFTSSILNAILADRTLGGVVQDCIIREVRGIQFDEVSGQWTADLPIEVLAKKVAA